MCRRNRVTYAQLLVLFDGGTELPLNANTEAFYYSTWTTSGRRKKMYTDIVISGLIRLILREAKGERFLVRLHYLYDSSSFSTSLLCSHPRVPRFLSSFLQGAPLASFYLGIFNFIPRLSTYAWKALYFPPSGWDCSQNHYRRHVPLSY